MKLFAVKVIVLTMLLGLAGALFFVFISPAAYSPVFPLLLLFVSLLTLISHYFQVSRIKSDFGAFARAHMVITIVRLFVFSGLTIIYLILTRENVVGFVVVVSILYIAFTLLETRELTKLTGRGKKNVASVSNGTKEN